MKYIGLAWIELALHTLDDPVAFVGGHATLERIAAGHEASAERRDKPDFVAGKSANCAPRIRRV